MTVRLPHPGQGVPIEGRARQGPATVEADGAGRSARGCAHTARTRTKTQLPGLPSRPALRARALAEARGRTKRAPTRRVRLAAPAHLRRGRGARREADERAVRRGSGWPVGGAWKCRERKRASVGGLWHGGKREYARGARGRGRIAGGGSPGAPELKVGVSPSRSSIHARRRRAAGSSARGPSAGVAR